MIKINNQYTVKIMGERRIRVFSYGMILMILGLAFFAAMLIHFEKADNLVLYLLLFGIFGITLIANIYMLFGTVRKLLQAQLITGVSFIVLALTLFVAFLFVLLGNKYLTIFISSVIFLLLLAVMRWLLIKTNYHNFKYTSKMGTTFFVCMVGTAIGRGIARTIEAQYGEAVELTVLILCLAGISAVFGFLGVFSINRYVLAKKHEFSGLVEYIE